MKKLSIFLLLIVGVVSCNNKDFYEGLSDESGVAQEEIFFKVSPEEAASELIDFLEQLDGLNANTRNVSRRDIANVCPIRKGIDVCTRTEAEDGVDDDGLQIDTLMYAINLSNNQGFALVAADRRTSPILAIIDEGSFSVDELSENEDEGLLVFIDYAVNTIQQDIKTYSEESTRAMVMNGYTITRQYGPFLHTKWAQDGVYGKYCPNERAGCVMIAAAQIMSYYQTVGHVSWSYNNDGGSADLHWDQIISDCDKYDGKLISNACAASGDEIAHFVRYLGLTLNAKYDMKTKETGADSSDAIAWFNDFASLNASKLYKYEEDTYIISALKAKYLVYGRGNAGKKTVLGIRVGWTDGHAWVYDGVVVASKGDESTNLLHCNWGWGGKNNGYYLGRVFNLNAGPVIYDDNDSQGSTYNFKYNLEYSIVRRKK